MPKTCTSLPERFAMGQLLKPATFKAQLDGKPLEGTNAIYGEGIATGDRECAGTRAPSTDTAVTCTTSRSRTPRWSINVNRLDRDNKSQSTAVLGMVAKVMTSHL